MSLAVIDFETATADRASACAVGVVLVDEGRISGEHVQLIQPPGNRYDAFNTYIHGLGPDDTRDAPRFAELWPALRHMLVGRLVVAHNAAFDVRVIQREVAAADLPCDEFDYLCTMVLARRALMGIGSYSLPFVCEHLDVTHDRHHDALADARACAAIAQALTVRIGTRTLTDTARALDVRVGRFASEWRSCDARHHVLDIGPDPGADPSHPFYGRSLSFTGTLTQFGRRQDAVAAVAALGGTWHKVPKRGTDYLVCGTQDPWRLRDDGLSGKLRRALELDVQILTELEFLQTL
jgi:DNA polymerase-3 subunit epsilon